MIIYPELLALQNGGRGYFAKFKFQLDTEWFYSLSIPFHNNLISWSFLQLEHVCMPAVGAWFYKLSSSSPLSSQSILVPLTTDMTAKEKTKKTIFHSTIENKLNMLLIFGLQVF